MSSASIARGMGPGSSFAASTAANRGARISRMRAVAVVVGLGMMTPLSTAAAPESEGEVAADAVIERWEQHWTIEADGGVRRRERQIVKIMNTRPIRRFADPRIDVRAGSERLTLHAARTRTPDGRTLDVPEYGINLAGPGDTAGWPAYADWQQQVVSFSGIEPGAVLELDYEIASPAGAWTWPGASIRLDDEYPIVSRVVSVTVPASVSPRFATDDPSCAWRRYFQSERDGAVVHTWEWSGLRAVTVEPQAVPRVVHGARLTFTTAPNEAGFVEALVSRVDTAAAPDEAIRAYAAKISKEEVTEAARVRKLAKTLRDRFNVVASPRVLRSLSIRPASEVYRANYGDSLEAAALLTASLRALDVSVSARVLIDEGRWTSAAPTLDTMEGVVVVVQVDDERLCFDARHGELFAGRGQRHRMLLGAEPRGGLTRESLAQESKSDRSEVDIQGTIALDADGQAKGTLTVGLSGVFLDRGKALSSEGQRSLLGSHVDRILTGFEISNHTVKELSPTAFRAAVEVKTKEALKVAEKLRVLRLGSGPAHLGAVPMPLDVSRREGDVQLADAFAERVELRIELPKGASPVVLPASMDYAIEPSGAIADMDAARQTSDVLTLPKGGRAAQRAAVEDGVVVWEREISVPNDIIIGPAFAPAELGRRGLRDVINDLRADASLTLAYSN